MSIAAPARPAVAIISNSCPPYRLHFLMRVARELTDVRLHSVFTHQISNAAWTFDPPPEIGPVAFGPGEPSDRQSDPTRALHEWRKGGRIIDWMRENQVRGAVVHGYNSPGLLRIIRWCHRNGVACLLHADSNIRGDAVRGWRAAVKRRLVTRVIEQCCAILPCGSLGAQYFQKYGAPLEKIFHMPVEPDYQAIQTIDPGVVERARGQLRLEPGRRRIIYSGRLAHEKRVDLLIDAFARIADQRPEWDLLLVGDGPLRQSLHERVPAPLRPRVIWAGFVSDQALVSGMYRMADVLVLPSDFEPWGLVINEAAAAGMAIVASDVVGAAAELVRDGVNGSSFARGQLSQLVQALLDVTDRSRIDVMKVASPAVLREWRDRADPVQGLRMALQYCDIVPRADRSGAGSG
jgi:glycosyltransferase involved in cell wall biosynthesis